MFGFLVLLPYVSKGYSWPEVWDVIKEVVAYRAIIYGLVEPRGGFEPPTNGLRGRRSAGLSYRGA